MEQEKIVKVQLDHSKEITISLVGTPNEVAGFLFTESRGGEAAPITVFTPDEAGDPQVVPPQERYYDQLRSIEEALASGRGASEIEDPVSERVLLPDGLLPFLDELPEWLQPNLIRPRRGFLDQPALLPRPIVAQWEDGIAALAAIAAQYDLPVEVSVAPIAARGMAVGQTIEGFLIVDVKDKGAGCREWVLEGHQNDANSLHVYSFRSRPKKNRAQCKVSSGSANVQINVNGDHWKPAQDLTPKEKWWPVDNQSSVPNNAEITTVVRNPGTGKCAYSLKGGCQISGAQF